MLTIGTFNISEAIMATIISGLAFLCVLLAVYVLILRNKLKQTKRNLKELIKENDDQQTTPRSGSGDIYFKVNRDFQITYINESGADVLGHTAGSLIGKSVFGTLIEDKKAYRETLASTLNKVNRHHATISTQIVLLKGNGQKQLMLCRERPLLNEILKCDGISFLCQDISETKALQEKLSKFQNRDTFTGGLNEQALTERFEHDFKLAQRYNREFSCVVVELKDVYNFISQGIDFETADKLLRIISDVCFANLTPNANIGRADKTKIVMVLNGASREKAQAIAKQIWLEAIPAIKKLGVDEYNAEMLVISYSNRKNYSDTYDGMWARIKRHIKTALKAREYGIVASDINGSAKRNKSSD